MELRRVTKMVSISAEGREVLMEFLLARLADLPTVPTLIEQGQLQDAERLGREFRDDLDLLLDQVGLVPDSGDLELTMPPEAIQRTFSALLKQAERWRDGMRTAEMERADLLVEICEVVLVENRPRWGGRGRTDP